MAGMARMAENGGQWHEIYANVCTCLEKQKRATKNTGNSKNLLQIAVNGLTFPDIARNGLNGPDNFNSWIVQNVSFLECLECN